MAVVGQHTPETCMLAYEYGRHLGLAFQIVDDVLDFTVSSPTPTHNTHTHTHTHTCRGCRNTFCFCVRRGNRVQPSGATN